MPGRKDGAVAQGGGYRVPLLSRPWQALTVDCERANAFPCGLLKARPRLPPGGDLEVGGGLGACPTVLAAAFLAELGAGLPKGLQSLPQRLAFTGGRGDLRQDLGPGPWHRTVWQTHESSIAAFGPERCVRSLTVSCVSVCILRAKETS